MANYKKKSGSGKGIAATIVAIAVLAAAYVFTSVGLGSYNPADWVNRTEEVTESQEGGGAILDETLSNGVRLTSARIAAADYDEYGVSAQAETAYSLVATVYDEEGESAGIPQDVIYSCYWQNPDSEWATGKDISDYYTVTSTGVNTANAECLQAFGEPIIIKATAYFNEDAYCTWEANYVKRVEELTITTSASIGYEEDIPVTWSVSYGTGTVTGDVTFTGYSFGINKPFNFAATGNTYFSYFNSQVNDAGFSDGHWQYNMQYTISDEISAESSPISGYINYSITDMFLDTMSPEDTTSISNATDEFKYLSYAYYSEADNYTEDIKLTVNYSYTYGDTEYSSGTSNTVSMELVGDYPQQSAVTGNDIVILH